MSQPIRLLELFAGYGGASFALKKLGIEFETVGFSEIDKYAIQCYNQNHWNIREEPHPELDWCPMEYIKEPIYNYGDATKINPTEIPDFDLLTGGFPCQAFSVAGRGLGELDTRGTLFNEIIRIAEVKKPRWMLLENVKGLTTKTHKATFDKILSELERIGYKVKWRVLNSKKYGTPQNRERIFFVCFREEADFVKFNFPTEVPLTLFLKDILEKNVDKKFYLSEEQQTRLLSKARSFKERFIRNNYSSTLCARDYKDPKVIQVNNPRHSNDRIYDPSGVSPTLNTMQGGHRQPFIVASRGRNPDNPSDRTVGAPTEQRLEPNLEGTSNALTSVQKDNWVFEPSDTHNCLTEAIGRAGSSSEYISSVMKVSGTIGQIRKLTPTECFRLMGFFDDNIKLEGISNSQRYKLAGNGWDINLVSQIFKELLNE